jgi:hypothetical protein
MQMTGVASSAISTQLCALTVAVAKRARAGNKVIFEILFITSHF